MSDIDPMQIDAAGGQVTDAQAVAIERTLIASVLADRSGLNWIGDELTAADFADPRLGRIFAGFYEMVQAQEPISALTVAGHLTGWGVRGITHAELVTWTADALPHETGWFARKVHELALRRGLADESVRMGQAARGSDGVGEILARSIERLRDLQTRGVREEVAAPTLDQVLAQDTSYDWAIEGLLERGDRLILTGSEGAGKSQLMRQIGILAAGGLHPFTGYDIPPVRVLFVDTENTAKQWARETHDLAAKVAQHAPVDPRDTVRIDISKRMDLTSSRDLGRLHALLDAYKSEVLFLGPLYRLVPFAIDTDDEATPLLTALDTIHDRGVTLVIEAHAGHGRSGSNERDMRPRGSSALMGWPEFGLGLRADKNGRQGEFELTRWRGHRDAKRAWPWKLHRDGANWPWEPSVRDVQAMTR